MKHPNHRLESVALAAVLLHSALFVNTAAAQFVDPLIFPNLGYNAPGQVVDQSQYLDQFTFANLGYAWAAQTFIPTAPNMSGAGFIVYNYNGDMSTTPISIGLWDGNPGLATSLRLAFGTVSVTAPTYAWSGFADVYWSPVAVTPGSTYWLTVGGAAPPAFPQRWDIVWFTGDAYIANGQGYPNGSIWDSDSGNETGPFIERSYGDAAFRTFTAVTPEPATLTLLATGLVGLAGAARRRRSATRRCTKP